MTEVFENDVFAFDERFLVFCAVRVGRAIFTVAETFIFFEVLSTGRAGPSDEAGLKLEPGTEAMTVFVEFFDEV